MADRKRKVISTSELGTAALQSASKKHSSSNGSSASSADFHTPIATSSSTSTSSGTTSSSEPCTTSLPPPDSTSTLPDDVISLIFLFTLQRSGGNIRIVNRLRSICKRFQVILQECTPISCITVSGGQYDSPNPSSDDEPTGFPFCVRNYLSKYDLRRTRVHVAPPAPCLFRDHPLHCCAARFRHLASVDFSSANWYYRGKITDANMICILRKVTTNLHSIDISHCTHLTGASIYFMAERFHHLSHLSLESVKDPSVADAVLVMAESRAHNMRSFAFAGADYVTDRFMKRLVQLAPALHSLHLTVCDQLTSNGFAESVSRLSQLKSLVVTASAFITGSTALTPTLQALPQLKRLELKGCNITDDTLKDLSLHCDDGLHYVGLSGCPVQDDGVIAVLTQCTQLLEVDVSFNSEVTDRIIEVALKHPTLQVLNTSMCPLLTKRFNVNQ